MKKGEMQSYFNKTSNRWMFYFNIIGAKGDKCYRMRVYQKTKFDMIQEGMTFKFHNALNKGNDELWVTSRSIIAYAAVVETDNNLAVPSLPED